MIAPESRGVPSKTQTFDDTIILDSVDLPGLGEAVLSLACQGRPMDPFFTFLPADLHAPFQHAAQLLQLTVSSVNWRWGMAD